MTKDHLTEIFSAYGTVKNVEMSKERGQALSHLHRGFAYIDYSTADEAETAMKHMDGGMFISFVDISWTVFAECPGMLLSIAKKASKTFVLSFKEMLKMCGI